MGVHLTTYLLDVLDHHALHVCNCAAYSVNGISARVMTPEVHSLPQNWAELRLIFVRCGALGGSWREAGEKLLLGFLQEGEGYSTTEGLQGLQVWLSIQDGKADHVRQFVEKV